MQDQQLSNLPAQVVTAEDDAASCHQVQAPTPMNTMLQQVLPRLRDIALYAALVGPVVVGPSQLDSLGHGGGW